MMRQTDQTTLLTQLLSIARQAGDAIMAVYQAEKISFQQKVDQSPVTQADLAAHNILLQQLGLLIPTCPVVSEEDKASQRYRNNKNSFWLIDPLDGTKEFVAHSDEFTVNIALIEEGHSILGVVYAPAIDTFYWGGPDIGAFRTMGLESTPIRIGVGGVAGVCRVVASKSHLNADTQAFIDHLGTVELLQAGSSLKFCRVAEGRADIYPRLAPTCEWDTAAAQAILEGAGGAVLDLQGQPLRYGKPDVLNPSFIAVRDITLIPV